MSETECTVCTVEELATNNQPPCNKCNNSVCKTCFDQINKCPFCRNEEYGGCELTHVDDSLLALLFVVDRQVNELHETGYRTVTSQTLLQNYNHHLDERRRQREEQVSRATAQREEQRVAVSAPYRAKKTPSNSSISFLFCVNR